MGTLVGTREEANITYYKAEKKDNRTGLFQVLVDMTDDDEEDETACDRLGEHHRPHCRGGGRPWCGACRPHSLVDIDPVTLEVVALTAVDEVDPGAFELDALTAVKEVDPSVFELSGSAASGMVDPAILVRGALTAANQVNPGILKFGVSAAAEEIDPDFHWRLGTLRQKGNIECQGAKSWTPGCTTLAGTAQSWAIKVFWDTFSGHPSRHSTFSGTQFPEPLWLCHPCQDRPEGGNQGFPGPSLRTSGRLRRRFRTLEDKRPSCPRPSR